MDPTERVRLDMRFPADLHAWVVKLAKSKKKSVTQLFIDTMLELKERTNDESRRRPRG